WPDAGLPPLTRISQLFIWPYAQRDFIPPALPADALIWAEPGPLARGDWEPEPYPLYVRYLVVPEPPNWPTVATWGDLFSLRWTEAVLLDEQTVQVDLVWAFPSESPPLTVFAHILDADGRPIAQDDAPPGGGNWPHHWQRPGLLLQERRILVLPEPYDAARHQIHVGLYDSAETRLPVFDAAGQAVGDGWELTLDE
ncbi:MAG: hypothetical protein GY803_32790, partial [Chloroflexi bacterium]|nr:hypothetical protein [Chloroflexota bacterium]